MSAARSPSSSCVPCSIGGNSASPLNSTIDARGLDRLADGVLHGDDLLAVLLVDHTVELSLGVRDTPVVGERLLVERVADALETGPLVLSDRSELVRLQLVDRGLDRGLPFLRVEPLAFGRGEDEVQDAALLGRELLFDQVRRPLRIRARDLELVLQAAAHSRDEDDEKGDDAQPGEDDTPRMRCARAHPGGERSGRQPLVSG